MVEGLLALPDGGGQREVGLHHPLLVAVQHRLARHGQGMALGHVLGQRGQGLLGLGKDSMRKVVMEWENCMNVAQSGRASSNTLHTKPTLPWASQDPNCATQKSTYF